MRKKGDTRTSYRQKGGGNDIIILVTKTFLKYHILRYCGLRPENSKM